MQTLNLGGSRTPVLDSILGDLRPEVRAGFVRAVATRPLVQKQWTNGRRGCLMAVAVMELTGRSIQQFQTLGNYVDQSVGALGIAADRVIAGYQEWDALHPEAAAAFVARLKAELAATTPPTPGVLRQFFGQTAAMAMATT